MTESLPAEAREMLGQIPGVGHPLAETGQPGPYSNGADEAAPNSLIAELRQQHRRIMARRSTIIELPLWRGVLGVRYTYLDERVVGRLLNLVSSASDPLVSLQANADILIGGCEEVLARRDPSEDWGPLVDGEHLRFEPRLAELLQLGRCDTARDVVYALFGGRVEGTMALGAHAARFIEWLQGETPGVVESLQGESGPQG